MSYPRELAIVIPCKNEVNYIGALLRTLSNQTYDLSRAKIIIADADSTDGTRDVILQFKIAHPKIPIDIIPGGLPSVARNRGAAHSNSQYILFIDADIELSDKTLIRRALTTMQRDGLHCATTDIKSRDAGLIAASLYGVSNLAQRLSRLSKPYSTGMFMLFERKEFVRLGGFDEKVKFAEDYHLSMKVKANKFRVIRGHVLTSSRRFRRSGYMQMAKLFLTTAINSRRQEHFYDDHNYWQGQY